MVKNEHSVQAGAASLGVDVSLRRSHDRSRPKLSAEVGMDQGSLHMRPLREYAHMNVLCKFGLHRWKPRFGRVTRYPSFKDGALEQGRYEVIGCLLFVRLWRHCKRCGEMRL